MTEPPTAEARTPATHKKTRIEGLDVARALAILGMFAAHFGEDTPETGWTWLAVSHGRSSALFAILAGVSIALMLTRKAGVPGNLAGPGDVAHTRWRVGVRGLMLIPLGYLLSAVGTPVIIILANLGVMFLLSLIAFRWSTWALWSAAGAFMVFEQALVTEITVLAQSSGVYGLPVIENLWSEYYPAVSWMGYILVGMAMGRLALRARRTQIILATAGGVGLAVAKVIDVVAGGPQATMQSQWLSTEAHSYSPLEMFGNVASACLVIGICLWLAQVARSLVLPLIAAGSMALTLYAAQVVVIAAVGNEIVWQPSNASLVTLCLSAVAFASLWRWLIGQGLLENLLSVTSMAAADAAVGKAPTDGVAGDDAATDAAAGNAATRGVDRHASTVWRGDGS